jgi:hypothetical protein
MMIRLVHSVPVLSILLGVSVAAAVQQPPGPTEEFSSLTIERSFARGAGIPSRVVRTRTESGQREVITESTEVPGLDGKLRLSFETTRDTLRTSADSTETKHEVFAPDAQGRRQLVESTQTDVQTFRDGSERIVSNTRTPDLNGRLTLVSREISEARSPSPNVTETETTIFRPGIHEPLKESERITRTERKVSPLVTQSDSTHFELGANGRWQTLESRSQEVRLEGSAQVTEETVRRPSLNGNLDVGERTVTTQSKSNGQDQTITEIYASENTLGVAGADNRLQLNQRLRVTTTISDAGQQTIREVEERNPGAPRDRLRVTERTIETLRQIGPNRWEVQREVFALDGNGRLVPVQTERGQAVGK